jgi:hypothetical protein
MGFFSNLPVQQDTAIVIGVVAVAVIAIGWYFNKEGQYNVGGVPSRARVSVNSGKADDAPAAKIEQSQVVVSKGTPLA